MNYFKILDENGNISTPIFVEQALTNIDRFHEIIVEVKGMQFDSQNLNIYNVNRLKVHSEDFYTTWQASSSMLINAIGISNCIQLFEIFRKYFQFISNSDEIIEFFMNESSSIELFRGESPSLVAEGICGVSWTIEESVALYYANRHSDGVVLKKTVSSKDVLAFLDFESEVIVRNSFA